MILDQAQQTQATAHPVSLYTGDPVKLALLTYHFPDAVDGSRVAGLDAAHLELDAPLPQDIKEILQSGGIRYITKAPISRRMDDPRREPVRPFYRLDHFVASLACIQTVPLLIGQFRSEMLELEGDADSQEAVRREYAALLCESGMSVEYIDYLSVTVEGFDLSDQTSSLPMDCDASQAQRHRSTGFGSSVDAIASEGPLAKRFCDSFGHDDMRHTLAYLRLGTTALHRLGAQ